jgi:hypothetical protein
MGSRCYPLLPQSLTFPAKNGEAERTEKSLPHGQQVF